MITALLTASFTWCLFYGRIPPLPLAAMCVAVGLILAVSGRRGHAHLLSVDILARASRLARVNPSLKFWTVLALMGICLSSQNPFVGILLAVAAFIFVVFVGGLSCLGCLGYLRLLLLPVSFLMLGGLAVLFEVSLQVSGAQGATIGVGGVGGLGGAGVAGVPCMEAGASAIININIFGVGLLVSPENQMRAGLIIARSLGCIGCLYLLSLTTPMPELIGALRRMRCPEALIDLMYLIYRYIFILLAMHQTMHNAAKSRLGHINYPATLRTTGKIYSNLLSQSYRQASVNFDAMESRCYDGGIKFLENEAKLPWAQGAIASAMIFVVFSIRMALG